MQVLRRTSEQEEPLLQSDVSQSRQQKEERPRRAAHPFWLIPVVIVVSMCRGLTLSSRIQVFNHLACQALSNAPRDTPAPFLQSLSASVRDIDSIPSPDCSSPAIQGRAAQIQATVITTMSILGAVTTGPWSRYGDLHGRKIILCTTIFGALSMDIIMLLITQQDTIFSRHGEGLIVLGPIVDGLVGGLSAFNGVVHAYASDCTSHGSRSKIFSTLQGIVYVGLSLGPWVMSIALRIPFVHKLSPIDSVNFLFKLSIVLYIAILTFVIIFLPESLPKLSTQLGDGSSSLTHTSDHRKPVGVWVRYYGSRLVAALLSPIAMFRPRLVGHRQTNWNITLLGSALFIYLLSIGIYQLKYLYAKHVYSWSAEQLGFYMSLLWTFRAVNLLILLPIIISYFKPKKAQRSSTDSSQPTDRTDIVAELHFDQKIAQYSLTVDGLADALVVISPISSQPAFILFSCLNSFTSGGNPAMHSLGAVCLHAAGRSDEVGSLFGAMAVLSAIAHTISPPIYALIYGLTVANYPKAIFCLASSLLATVVCLISMIKPDRGIAASQYSLLQTEDVEGTNECED